MSSLRFAAIDIGSNAVRLLLASVIGNGKSPVFKKECLIRMPIRLGSDAFLHKKIGESKASSLIKTMKAFKQLIEAYDAVSFAACGTSALREATNGPELVKRIREESKISIEIVEGGKEAELICLNHPEKLGKSSQPFLYVDVGGGSTELTLMEKGKIVESTSMNIGTVRLLNNLVSEKTWKELKQWTKKLKKAHKPIEIVGSGGNINKLFRMARLKSGEPLSYKKLSKLRDLLAGYTVEERVSKLDLRPDRADVIVPAADIFLAVMKWSGGKSIDVPQIGLADGLVHMLYNQHVAEGGAKDHRQVKTAALAKHN